MPRKAVIELKMGEQEILAGSVAHAKELLWEKFGVDITFHQCTRLCNEHRYQRPQFRLPEGLSIKRLNTTRATVRNRA